MLHSSGPDAFVGPKAALITQTGHPDRSIPEVHENRSTRQLGQGPSVDFSQRSCSGILGGAKPHAPPHARTLKTPASVPATTTITALIHRGMLHPSMATSQPHTKRTRCTAAKKPQMPANAYREPTRIVSQRYASDAPLSTCSATASSCFKYRRGKPNCWPAW